MLIGCATSQPAVETKTTYPGRCQLIQLEQRELPSDQPSDQVALVATYRFGRSNAPGSKPVVFAFQVTRARAEDLRSHLSDHSEVVCRPDESPRALEVPPSEKLGVVQPMPASERP